MTTTEALEIIKRAATPPLVETDSGLRFDEPTQAEVGTALRIWMSRNDQRD